jgi:hypothetical protein
MPEVGANQKLSRSGWEVVGMGAKPLIALPESLGRGHKKDFSKRIIGTLTYKDGVVTSRFCSL